MPTPRPANPRRRFCDRRTPARAMPTALVFALAATCPAAGYADILIDDFAADPFEVIADESFGTPRVFFNPLTTEPGTPAGFVPPQDPLSGVVGAVRTARFSHASLDQPGLDRVRARVFNDGASVLDVDHTAGAASTLDLMYGEPRLLSPGGDTPPTTFAPILAAGHDRIELDFLGFDSPGGQPLHIDLGLTAIEIVSGQGTAGPLTLTMGRSVGLSVEFNTTGPSTLSIDLSGLEPDILASASLLSLSFTAPAGADFRLDAIRAVPEPASLTLLTLGAAAALARRRA